MTNPNTTVELSPLEHLELLTKDHAAALALVAERATDLQDEYAALKRRRIPGIKSAAARAADSRDALRRHIIEHPELFAGKAKTLTLHGIRCGIVKGAGKLSFANAGKVVAAIRRVFQSDAEQYLTTKVSPDRTALKKLSVAQLSKLGCQLTDTEDTPMIKATSDEIDKFVDKLIREDAETAQ